MNADLKKIEQELKRMKAIQGQVSDYAAYNRRMVELTKKNNDLVQKIRKENIDKIQVEDSKVKIKDYLKTDPRWRDQWQG